MDGRITLGAFVAFNGYLGYLAWPTIALGWTLANVRRGLASMARIGEILDAPRGSSEPGAPRAPSPPSRARGGAIELTRPHLRVRRARPPALSRRLASRVPRGRAGGRGGADGQRQVHAGRPPVPPLRSAPRARLPRRRRRPRDPARHACAGPSATCPQEPFLFSRSIRDNLRLRRRVAPRPGAPDGGGARRRSRRRGRRLSGWMGDGGGRAGPHAVRRAAPASRPGARARRRSRDPGARRPVRRRWTRPRRRRSSRRSAGPGGTGPRW